MEITEENIRLLQSENMTDEDDGGGLPSSTVIIDGASNQIFPDISLVDREAGSVKLRAVFPAVHTPDTDTYAGAMVYIGKPPLDANVSVTLFETGSFSDRRIDAQNRIESYLARGPRLQAYLYDQHIAGQQALVLIAKTSVPLPSVGDTIVVTINPALPNERSQFLRIRAAAKTEQAFSVANEGDFVRAIWTLDVSDPLEFDVQGGQPSRYDDANQSIPSRVYGTRVANATKYYSAQPLAEAAGLGEYSVKVASMFNQLVPAAQQELPISDASPYGTMATPVPAADGIVSFTTSANFGPEHALFIGQGAYPNSLEIDNGTTLLIERGGKLYSGDLEVGSADLENGVARIAAGGPNLSGTKTVRFRPGAVVPRNVYTSMYSITAATRTGTLSGYLLPAPLPGTLRVSFRSQGNWYVLADDGAGGLRGAEPAYGGGQINHASGAAVVTMGALPDVDTAVLFVWGSKSMDVVQPAFAAQLDARFVLSNAVDPGLTTLSWPGGSATVNAAGVISGDASGQLNVASGLVQLRPNTLPAGPFTVAVTRTVVATRKTASVSVMPEADQVTYVIQLPDENIEPGKVEITWMVPSASAIGEPKPERLARARDNGSGGLIGLPGATVDYALGRITLQPASLSVPASTDSETTIVAVLGDSEIPIHSDKFRGDYMYKKVVTLTDTVTTGAPYLQGGAATFSASYAVAGAAGAGSENHVIDRLHLSLTPGEMVPMVPRTLRFTLGNQTHVEQGGRVLRDINPATGVGTDVGSCDLGSCLAELTQWPAGVNSVQVQGMARNFGAPPATEFHFRTPIAPTRPGALTLAWQFADSPSTSLVTANASGVISGTDVSGFVDVEAGIVRVWFGRKVVAAGNESQPWYNPALVDPDGNIFRPREIISSSLRYSTVGYSYLPMDAQLLGINPVRLPTDGRVPIYRPGELVVIHHTDTVSGTYVNGQTVACGRGQLSRVRVRDANGLRIPKARFTADLDTGEVTFVDVSGLAQPLTVEHTIANMRLVTDVQINGLLRLLRPLSRSFPADALVSSALRMGNLFARATNVFEQKTWTNVWSDSLIGDAPTASFNAATYPITVTNDGAITEQWALIFTNGTEFRVVGREVGQIAMGNVTTACAPINPVTGKPYFTVPALGWGAGWAAQNVLRFNTVAAARKIWNAQTIAPGDATHPDDSYTLEIYGDIDA